VASLAAALSGEGRLVLAEIVPSRGERILSAFDWSGLDPDLARRAIEAEAAIYEDRSDPQVNWDERDLPRWCEAAGLKVTHRELLRHRVALVVSAGEIARWFERVSAKGANGGSREGKLGERLGKDAPAVRRILEPRLAGQTLIRQLAVALVVGERT
jgi:hypothetical protein